MRLLLFLGILVSVAIAHNLPSSHVIGGVIAQEGEFPYMVSLRKNNGHFCGGSIISKRYILTAAHCIKAYENSDSLESLSVHVGTNWLSELGDSYTVEKAIPHANYSSSSYINDIGVLRLTKDVVYSKVVQPVPYATTNFVQEGDLCTICGWGSIKLLEPLNLQKLDLKVFPQFPCNGFFPNIQESHVCALSTFGQGICYGDSGGPLVVTNGTQIGIASFVRLCGVGLPDVYTRVSAFKDWIIENTK